MFAYGNMGYHIHTEYLDRSAWANNVTPDQTALSGVCIVCHLSLGLQCLPFHHNNRHISGLSIEPVHDKTNKMACVPSEDSGQPGPPSLIRVCSVRMKLGSFATHWVHSKDSDQTGGWLGWSVFAGCTCICWLNWSCSNYRNMVRI